MMNRPNLKYIAPTTVKTFGRQCTVGMAMLTLMLANAKIAQSAVIVSPSIGTSLEMQGDWLYTGISNNGTLGVGDNTEPGLQFDPTGTGNFSGLPDYLTPGAPYEGFSVSYDGSGGVLLNNNSGGAAPIGPISNPIDISGTSEFDNAVRWSGSIADTMSIEHVFSFNDDEKNIGIATTITALDDLTGLKFSRWIDPDSGGTNSINSRGNGVLGLAPEDWVNSVSEVNGATLGLYSDSEVTHDTGISPSWSQDPATYAAGGVDGDGTTTNRTGDDMIGIGFDIGALSNGESVILRYFYAIAPDPNDIDVAPPAGVVYLPYAQTRNQAAVAGLLDQLSAERTGDFATALDEFDTVIELPGGSAYLDQLGGELYGTTASVGLRNTNMFLETVSRRLRTTDAFAAIGQGRALRASTVRGQAPSRLQAIAETWRPWIQGYGVSGHAGGDGNASSFNYSIGGTTVAMDRALNDCTRFGLVGGYAGSVISLNDPGQRSYVDSGQFGMYLQRYCACHYTTGIFSYGYSSYDTSRRLAFGELSRDASANYDGNEFAMYLEHGRILNAGRFQIQPYGALQYIYLHQSAFTESGADALNLAVNGMQTDSFTGLLGSRVTTYKKLGCNRVVAPELHALWRHEFLDENRLVNASFAGVPGSSFAVAGADLGRDAAVLGGGCNLYLGQRVSLFANYDLLLNSEQVAHAGVGGLQVLW